MRQLTPNSRDLHPCPLCDGSGGLIVTGGPGYYNDNYGNWLPLDYQQPCPACCGSGHAMDLEDLEGDTSPSCERLHLPAGRDADAGMDESEVPF